METASPCYATHEVLNQAGPFEGYNAFSWDTPLREATRACGADCETLLGAAVSPQPNAAEPPRVWSPAGRRASPDGNLAQQ